MMQNVLFSEDTVTENDLYFLCYMIERIARTLKQHNRYVVNTIPEGEWLRLISLADVLHSENPLQVEHDWIQEYKLQEGNFDITKVDPELTDYIPTETQMGKVYTRLIVDTLQPGENYVHGMIRVYNDPICELIDYYDCGAFYEPSYVIARAYLNGTFEFRCKLLIKRMTGELTCMVQIAVHWVIKTEMPKNNRKSRAGAHVGGAENR